MMPGSTCTETPHSGLRRGFCMPQGRKGKAGAICLQLQRSAGHSQILLQGASQRQHGCLLWQLGKQLVHRETMQAWLCTGS